MVFRRSRFRLVKMHMQNVVSGTKLTGLFFAECGRNRCQYFRFLIVDIWIRSRDISNHILKLSEIALHFSLFCPHFFFGGGNFTCGL